ncbi:MAG: STAS domain-containing protein [Methylocystaceae bacterium]|nr:STAS domain-containing protein [Methylocystaceae bacterium]
MDYSVKEDQTGVTIDLNGELTVSDEEQFRSLCFDVTKRAGQKCVADLSQLSFLDSAGLGLLLVLKEMCEDVDKQLTLRVGNSAVRDILDISEFSSLIPYETS